MKIKVDNGKYTFVKSPGGYRVHILRYGEEWVQDIDASNAVVSMMCELDAARVVLVAVRNYMDPNSGEGCGEDYRNLKDALKKHDALVSDNEPPSEWTK